MLRIFNKNMGSKIRWDGKRVNENAGDDWHAIVEAASKIHAAY